MKSIKILLLIGLVLMSFVGFSQDGTTHTGKVNINNGKVVPTQRLYVNGSGYISGTLQLPNYVNGFLTVGASGFLGVSSGYLTPTPGANGYVLTSNGTASSWNLLTNSNISPSAALAVSKLAAGTNNYVLRTSAGVPTWGLLNLGTDITGTLPVANGGLNLTSYTVGDIIYASGTTALSKLSGVATGNALISGGVGTAPSWGKVGLTTHVSGVLGVSNGGTGISSLTANYIPYGNGTSALSSSSALTFNGSQLTVTGAIRGDTTYAKSIGAERKISTTNYRYYTEISSSGELKYSAYSKLDGSSSAAPVYMTVTTGQDIGIGNGSFARFPGYKVSIDGTLGVNGNVSFTSLTGYLIGGGASTPIISSTTIPSTDITGNFALNRITGTSTYIPYVGTGGTLTSGSNFTFDGTNSAMSIGTVRIWRNGTNSIGIGQNALTGATGSRNIAIGDNTLDAGLAGDDNIGFGYNALSSGILGINNVGIGSNALALSTSSNNVAIGYNAMNAATTGSNNVAIGSGAGNGASTTASNNTFINSSGSNSSGSNNIAIGDGTNDRILINSSGNMGVGLTPGSTYKVDVNGLIATPGSVGGGGGYVLKTNTGVGASRSWRIVSDFTSYGGLDIQQSTTQLGATFATKMYFSPAGNIGIGGISNPPSLLTVSGSGATAVMTLQRPLFTASANIGSYGFANGANNYLGAITYAHAASDSTAAGAMSFRLGNANSNSYGLTERMQINSVGVGIGTAAGSNLHVQTGAAETIANYTIIQGSSSTDFRGGLLLSTSSATTAGHTSFKISTGANTSSSASLRIGVVANATTGSYLQSGPAIELFYSPANMALFGAGGGSVSVGGTTSNSQAILDVQSTTKGLKLPVHTTAQRTAVTTPTEGLMVYDSDVDKLFVGNGSSWERVSSYKSVTTHVYDVASIAAGANTSTTFTVTGAAFGDIVLISTSINQSGVQLWGHVSASDTVTVYFENRTASPVDLASATYTIRRM